MIGAPPSAGAWSTIAGILLFIRDTSPKLAGTGITPEQAGEILGATAGAPSAAGLDPQRTAWVISEATSSMLGAAQTLNLAMAAIPAVAIVIAVVLFRRRVSEPYATLPA